MGKTITETVGVIVGDNFFPAVDALRGKLEQFYTIHRRGEAKTILRDAVNQLQEELDTARVLLATVGEGVWRSFPEERRWGYLLLLSLMETGRLEIEHI